MCCVADMLKSTSSVTLRFFVVSMTGLRFTSMVDRNCSSFFCSRIAFSRDRLSSVSFPSSDMASASSSAEKSSALWSLPSPTNLTLAAVALSASPRMRRTASLFGSSERATSNRSYQKKPILHVSMQSLYFFKRKYTLAFLE